MKPFPILRVDADTFVRHSGNMVGQFRWFEAWGDTESHWWCEKLWWRE